MKEDETATVGQDLYRLAPGGSTSLRLLLSGLSMADLLLLLLLTQSQAALLPVAVANPPMMPSPRLQRSHNWIRARTRAGNPRHRQT